MFLFQRRVRIEFAMKRVYVGNLPYSMNDDGLSDLFGEHGAVASARVIVDRETGRSRGFGFVEFDADGEGDTAITAMNGHEIDGRALTVNEARPREERGGGGGGGYRGGGGGGGGGGHRGGGGGRSQDRGGW